MSIGILLAEDHTIVRQGLCSLIETQSDMHVVGAAENGLQAVAMAMELQPDVVLMDVRLPALNGIEATGRIKAQKEDIKVLALSMHADREFIMGMVNAGASGYLLKDCIVDDLVKAIRCVVKGDSYLCPRATAIVLEWRTEGTTSSGHRLDIPLRDREIEVLKLLTEGRTAKGISLDLGMSVKTIEGNRRQIMNKLGIDNIPGLVKYAIGKGLTALEFEVR